MLLPKVIKVSLLLPAPLGRVCVLSFVPCVIPELEPLVSVGIQFWNPLAWRLTPESPCFAGYSLTDAQSRLCVWHPHSVPVRHSWSAASRHNPTSQESAHPEFFFFSPTWNHTTVFWLPKCSRGSAVSLRESIAS